MWICHLAIIFLPPLWSQTLSVEEPVALFQTSSTELLDAYLLFLLVVILIEAFRGRIGPAVFFLFNQFMYFPENFSIFLLP